ncbi:hypothetical protein IFM89_037993 [Coptis chinensis]|uniref:WEB family protein n=1 Tax=Coptis chinensis TaxID=261450 RepID=A0A835I7M1_9MAGN|nr:hypothetical protein IFM89_037993 [Coptis chinensis]
MQPNQLKRSERMRERPASFGFEQRYVTNTNMVSSKPNQRTGSLDFDQKTSSSAQSKQSKSALVSSGAKSSKITYLAQSVVKGLEMQQQLGTLEEEFKKTKEELAAVEEAKLRVVYELGEMKKVADAANARLTEALSAQEKAQERSRVHELEKTSIESAKKRDQAWQIEFEAVQKQHAVDVEALSTASEELQRLRQELMLVMEAKDSALKEASEAKNTAEVNANTVMDKSIELRSVKASLTDSNAELEVKQKYIESIKLGLERAKNMEKELREKDASWEELRHEPRSAKDSEPKPVDLSSDSNIRVQKLELEVEKAKESEGKMSEALLFQTKQFEETKVLLEEAKLEITYLQKEVQSLEASVGQSKRDLDVSHRCLEKAKVDTHSIKEAVETLKFDLKVAKDGLAHAKEGEENALSKVRSLIKEMNILKNELKLATEAEEKSKKAMDDLALVLIEVSKENKEAKESLRLTQSDLDSTKVEAESSKQKLNTTEEQLQQLLEDAMKETDQLKSVSERLKLEAEDSIFAWNQKELEFVSCIRRADEESNASKQENRKLKESLRTAEDMAKVAREENCKLRDILKQALNETSAAKEAAEIAREENSQMKDNLLDKDDMLQDLTRENERLRIKESAGHETIKELKRLLSSKSSKNLKTVNMDQEWIFKKQHSTMKEHKDNVNIKEILNLKFEEPQIPNGHKDENEDPEMTEMLKGSIFDVVASPDGPKPVSHHRKMSSSGGAINLEDTDHQDGTQSEDSEDKNSLRKKRALLRRFGELLRKTSYNKRES